MAARDASVLERAADDSGGDAEADVVIEAIDSTTWEMRAADQQLVRRFSTFAAADRVD